MTFISILDHRTLHSGCPVLVGTKWVANKWIHVQGQEWTRPCVKFQKNLEEDFMSEFKLLFKKGELKI